MKQEERSEVIMRPGRPRGGLFGKSLTVGPNQVGIVIRDGQVVEVFSEGRRKLPRGRVKTYVVSRELSLIFWLTSPGGPISPEEGIPLDLPVLTADGHPVTGRIELRLSVDDDIANRLLRMPRMADDEIRKSEIVNVIRGELLAKVLALDLPKYTSAQLRGNRDLFADVYNSIRRELGSTFSRYGLRLHNFNAYWFPTLEKPVGGTPPTDTPSPQPSPAGGGVAFFCDDDGHDCRRHRHSPRHPQS